MNNRQIFLQNIAQTSDFPLMLEINHAKGVYMYEKSGKSYIDMISGIGVSSLGHCHPKVVKSVQKQAETYMHLMVYGEFVQSPQVEFAKSLVKTLPKHLQSTYLVNSGSEAVEGALKLAKRYTGRKEMISCIDAYHGSTHGALSVGGDEELKANYRPLLPHVSHIRFNNVDDLGQITTKTACIIIETIQGEAGVILPQNDYLKSVRERCNETGTLLILDEVQTGAGRTGKFWAFEHYGITPDIIVTAKGIGGGMPIGAFISSNEIMNVLKDNPILGHITTFGGHPVSAAAAHTCVEELINTSLIEEVEEKAELIKSLLVKHPAVKSIRNKGLLMAVQFDSFEQNKKIIDKAIELGLLSDWFLYCDDSLRIAPPLIITKEEIKIACKIILDAIDKIE